MTAPTADPAPHTHHAVMAIFETALQQAAGNGPVARFRTSDPDDAGRRDWYLELASGGVHELRCVSGTGAGGSGVLGMAAGTIVTGPAPARVDLPADPRDVEGWVAAVITNAAPIDADGQSWLRAVETETQLAPTRSPGWPHQTGVYAHHHSGGVTAVYWLSQRAR